MTYSKKLCVISFMVIVFITMTIGTAMAQDKPYAGTTITITSLNAAWADAAIAMLPEFEKQTGIKVVWEPLPFDSIHEKQVTDMAASMGTYDVISFDNPWLSEFAGSNWLEDLGPFVEKTKFAIDDYPAQLMEYWRYNGKLIALPFQPDCRMIFYRKDLFEQAGFTFTPRYWDEFAMAAEKLNRPADKVYGWDFSPAKTIVTLVELLPWIWANGGDLFDQNLKPV
ncbi:MAG: extracellular solute-binding protein, partial [Candidatus Atribacteria bacterium]|nr:extracellular solute-binding protein [Candidatus Atribacteria bacterium]